HEWGKISKLLLVNKQWYYNASRLIWHKITLTGISGVKFTNALSKNTKPKSCEQVLSLKFIGTINIGLDVYISEVCKACANLQQLSFENCGSRIINNKNLEALLVECSNLKSLAIRGSRCLSPKTITKIPKLAPNLETIEINEAVCLKPKMYSILPVGHDPKTPDDSDSEDSKKKHSIQKAKSVKKYVVKRELRHDKFLECLRNKRLTQHDMYGLRSYDHQIYMER
ncbi:21117_t:CDS:2, partial [Dentiscutata erythropus]